MLIWGPTTDLHCVCLYSERASASGATGERLKEGGNINKSLVTLGIVISTLGKNHWRYGRSDSNIALWLYIVLWVLKSWGCGTGLASQAVHLCVKCYSIATCAFCFTFSCTNTVIERKEGKTLTVDFQRSSHKLKFVIIQTESKKFMLDLLHT